MDQELIYDMVMEHFALMIDEIEKQTGTRIFLSEQNLKDFDRLRDETTVFLDETFNK